MEKGFNDLGGVCLSTSALQIKPSLLGSLENLAKNMMNLKFLHQQAYVSALKQGFIHWNAYLSRPLSLSGASC